MPWNRSSRPDHAAPAATHNRAVGYYLAEDHSATEATIRRNIRDYPEHPRAYLWLAAALGLLGHSGAGAARNEAGHLRYKMGNRAPYMRPQDHQHLFDGLKAGWDG